MKYENTTICRMCSSTEIAFLHKGMLFGNINVSYFECQICGYVQTETPYWLDRAYSETINASDTGIMWRNQTNARITLATMMMLGELDALVVDYAGGYGILVRLLRDYGVNALWSDRYCTNLLARGFEHIDEDAKLVTCFEALEHFVDPAEEFSKMFDMAPNVLLSTELIAEPAPKQDNWWYYGQEHGQHIGFIRHRTLEKIAKETGKFLLSDGHSYHLFSETKISPISWYVLVRANKVLPVLLRKRLLSKTWTDHIVHTVRVN